VAREGPGAYAVLCDGGTVRVTPLATHPRLWRLRRLLSRAECEHVIRTARPALEASSIA
jgi:hypothetical protein